MGLGFGGTGGFAVVLRQVESVEERWALPAFGCFGVKAPMTFRRRSTQADMRCRTITLPLCT
jgi:hypothetical protein